MISLIFKVIVLLDKSQNKCLLDFYKIVSDGIFFSLIFKVMIEGIIEISIYSYFNYKSPNFNSVGEALGIS